MRKPFKFLCQKYFVRPYIEPPRRKLKGSFIGSVGERTYELIIVMMLMKVKSMVCLWMELNDPPYNPPQDLSTSAC